MSLLASLPSLPVRLDVQAAAMSTGVYGASGLVRSDGADLVIETRPITASGEGEVETYRLALDDVSDVELKAGWTRTRLVLRPRRLTAVEGLPGVSDGHLVLKVARRNRDLASRWATALSLALAERLE